MSEQELMNKIKKILPKGCEFILIMVQEDSTEMLSTLPSVETNYLISSMIEFDRKKAEEN